MLKTQFWVMGNYFDSILGGPKLRKWYGVPDLVTKDESTIEDEDDDSGSTYVVQIS